MTDELKPTSAAEIIKDFEGDFKVVSAGKHNYKIKKINILELAMTKVISLPVFREKEFKETELIEEARKFLNDDSKRLEILKDLTLRCTVDPQVVDGQSDAEKNHVSYTSIDDFEKMELVGKIMDFNGYSTSKAQFFRDDAGTTGAGPGSHSKEVLSSTSSPAPANS